ncbi:MAG: alpha/beta fold hydrolase [Steroidobacteraceae bacterium]
MLKYRAAPALACLFFVACGRAPAPAAPAAADAAAAPASRAGPTAVRIANSADGVPIAYRVYGHGDPAVVLIHGWACDSTYWHAQLADLAAKYTTVTLDLAGHGASGRNRTDWSMARFGQDVAAVVQQLASARVILVGHSMGGPVALEAAAILGPRVIGIVGIDTFKSLGLPPPPRATVAQAVAPFRADFTAEMHRFVPTLFEPHADAAIVRRVTDDMAREPPRIAIAALVSLNTMDYRTLLPRVRAPIVAIDSDLGYAESEARIRSVVPSFHLITMKGDGHFLMLEDPKHFNPILLREIEAMAQNARRSGRGG